MQNSFIKTPKRNVRKVDGECLTEPETMKFLREEEEAKKLKSKKRIFPDAENDAEKKCKKCRKLFSSDILRCENLTCRKWVCESCWPVKFKKAPKGTEFFCTKKCSQLQVDVDDDGNMSIKDITDTSEQEQDSEDDQVKRLGKEITAKYCKKCKKSFISGIRACENSKCDSWVCDFCLPKN